MFIDLLRAVFGKKRSEAGSKQADVEDAVGLASRCMQAGDVRGAADWLREALTGDPYNVGLLNDLGACLNDMGDSGAAQQAFDLAYSLDDTHIAAVVNRAKMLIEAGRSSEALLMLKRARIVAPHLADVYSVYGAYCMTIGNSAKTAKFYKKAWLANFEKLRFANAYLFHLSYADQPETLLAAEHRFWAETLRPVDVRVAPGKSEKQSTKTRIAYWSPDLRGHSVRYFLRPLLSNHDRNHFEVYVYHDGPKSDEQTEAIRKESDCFFETFAMSDQSLCDLMISHDLDVLVELAGHSSHNRIVLLQERFAKIQLTGLGYPPTTGLSSIDGKILDKYVVDENSVGYYTEKPIALPESFWCYDPMEVVPEVSDAPCLANGYVVFGCVGNISKITDSVVGAWVQIMRRVPDSMLLIRSINFRDGGVKAVFLEKMIGMGIDAERLILKEPAGGQGFYESYSEIDIVLDTYPFNGGTTSCFAAYMGVPVVTMSGASLPSRMGKSVMSNLGLGGLVAADLDAYVEVAISLGSDHLKLDGLRKSMRGRFLSTSLGDGKKYARDFESSCVSMLQEKRSGYKHQHHVPQLSENELVRRAYKVMSLGPSEALDRIIHYLEQSFSGSDAVHVLKAQYLALTDVNSGLIYLKPKIADMSGLARSEALITVAAWYVQLQRFQEAEAILAEIDPDSALGDMDQVLKGVLRTTVDAARGRLDVLACRFAGRARVHAVIVSGARDAYEKRVVQLRHHCRVPESVQVFYHHVLPDQRLDFYSRLPDIDLQDFVFVIHDHVSLECHDWMDRVLVSLQKSDVVGYCGARRWSYLDFGNDAFDEKFGAWLVATLQPQGGQVEINLFGAGVDRYADGMAVLDGSFMACRASWIHAVVGCSEELASSGPLLEQYMSFQMSKEGAVLGVRRDLGVVLAGAVGFDQHAVIEAKLAIIGELAIDVFADEADDSMPVMVAAPNVEAACLALDAYMRDEI